MPGAEWGSDGGGPGLQVGAAGEGSGPQEIRGRSRLGVQASPSSSTSGQQSWEQSGFPGDVSRPSPHLVRGTESRPLWTGPTTGQGHRDEFEIDFLSALQQKWKGLIGP